MGEAYPRTLLPSFGLHSVRGFSYASSSWYESFNYCSSLIMKPVMIFEYCLNIVDPPPSSHLRHSHTIDVVVQIQHFTSIILFSIRRNAIDVVIDNVSRNHTNNTAFQHDAVESVRVLWCRSGLVTTLTQTQDPDFEEACC